MCTEKMFWEVMGNLLKGVGGGLDCWGGKGVGGG